MQACKTIIENGCEQDLDIEEVLARYDHLSPAQKQQFINKAALYNNRQRRQDFEELLDDALDLLIRGALVGL